MYAKGGNTGGAFSQTTENATVSQFKWVKSNKAIGQPLMTDNCRDVLEELGYPIDVNSTVLAY